MIDSNTVLKLENDRLIRPRHIIGVDDFELEQIDQLFKLADDYKLKVQNKVDCRGDINPIDPAISFFEEPSTRTRFSFEMAAKRLGLAVLTTEAGKVFSSKAKGESIEDTAINLSGYSPSVVIGRFEHSGEARRAADQMGEVPLINGGDGKGEHPTQALLDAYTVQSILGSVGGQRYVLGGDLLNGRTVHSLVELSSRYEDNQYVFVSPEELKMPEEITDELKNKNIEFEHTTDVEEALNWADVVYWTRLQAERITNRNEKLEMIKKQKRFAIGLKQISSMKEHGILLHPLPRVMPGFVDSAGDTLEAEILPEVDNDSRARYFEQSQNGMYTRMALLRWALEPMYGHTGKYPPKN